MTGILLTTLGTWSIIPELIAFTNPEVVDLYAHHPEIDRIRASRERFAVHPVDELWAVTTDGEKAGDERKRLKDWYRLVELRHPPRLRFIQAKGIEDLASEEDVRDMAETIFRAVLHAHYAVQGGQLLLSLAGGRKTMSSDLQRAAAVFGCHALLHVIQNDTLSVKIRNASPEDFTRPSPADWRNVITPIVTGRYNRSPILDAEPDDSNITPEHFPLDLSGNPWQPDLGRALLVDAIEQRQREAGSLLANTASRMRGEEPGANFMALYSLPPRTIAELKNTRIGLDPALAEREKTWLAKLPKAELHCHLGGVADAAEIVEIAQAARDMTHAHREALAPWLAPFHEAVRYADLEQLTAAFRPKQFREAVPSVSEPAAATAFALLFEVAPKLLDDLIFRDKAQANRFRAIGFDAYETLGDLQGSSLLQSEPCLRAACRILLRKAHRHNVRYLELRCSPLNYTRGGLSGERAARIVAEELEQGGIAHGLIFIASRHGKMSRVYEHVELAQQLMGAEGNDFPALRGFDLAGNEQSRGAGALREAFLPLMERCLRLTIHAGEGEDVRNIWEAVYHLNAERIGHGLTLRDNPALETRFRDRNIAIEMCPSSNFQIVGFRDNYLPETHSLRIYPLKRYLDNGLRVTVNTDNPGISRTDFTSELHRAARLTPGGLSQWEILRLVRNGFKACFAEHSQKQKLLEAAEREIIGLLKQDPRLGFV